MCGYCLGLEFCYYVNGSCFWGCQDDYIIDRCFMCKEYILFFFYILMIYLNIFFWFYCILNLFIEILLFKNMFIILNFFFVVEDL